MVVVSRKLETTYTYYIRGNSVFLALLVYLTLVSCDTQKKVYTQKSDIAILFFGCTSPSHDREPPAETETEFFGSGFRDRVDGGEDLGQSLVGFWVHGSLSKQLPET